MVISVYSKLMLIRKTSYLTQSRWRGCTRSKHLKNWARTFSSVTSNSWATSPSSRIWIASLGPPSCPTTSPSCGRIGSWESMTYRSPQPQVAKTRSSPNAHCTNTPSYRRLILCASMGQSVAPHRIKRSKKRIPKIQAIQVQEAASFSVQLYQATVLASYSRWVLTRWCRWSRMISLSVRGSTKTSFTSTTRTFKSVCSQTSQASRRLSSRLKTMFSSARLKLLRNCRAIWSSQICKCAKITRKASSSSSSPGSTRRHPPLTRSIYSLGYHMT